MKPTTSISPVTSLYIEFYRGIAALMVMCCHYAPIIYGDQHRWLKFLWTGVDLFFVISGFVFAPQIIKGGIDYFPFIIRRIFRIYPLYLLSLFLYFYLTPSIPEKNEYFINHLFFLYTLHSKSEAFYFNPAFWSLPPEVEFYLCIPLIGLWINSFKKTIFLVLGAFALHYFIYFDLNISEKSKIIYSVHLPGLLIEFLMGIVVFYFVQKSINLYFKTILFFASVSSLLGLAYFFIFYGDEGIINNSYLSHSFDLLVTVCYATILILTLNRKPEVTLTSLIIENKERHTRPFLIQGLFNKVCTLLGQVSYGTYLFHNAIPRVLPGIFPDSPFMRFIAYCLVTLVLSLILNRLIEQPFKQFGAALSQKLTNTTNKNPTHS